jgi:hypothetical protein
MKLMAFAAASLLTACASQPQPTYTPRIFGPDDVARMPIARLCLGVSTWGPTSAGNAQAELIRRGVDCRDHAQAIQQEAQERAQAMGILMQNMNRPAPTYTPYQVPPPPGTGPQTTCNSRMIGNQMQTVCR